MKVPLVDLKAQYQELKEELETAVNAVLASGMYAPSDNVRLLEKEIAASCGVRFGVACNSGTDALKISLQAMGIGPGDEVITTPFTFVATIEAIIQNGGRPVFVDIEPETFNIDVSRVEGAITGRTKALLPIHLFGQMAEMEPLMEIADRHNLMVLEDAAQAIGSTRNGRHSGNWGIATALSFFPTKNLGAAGDAGMILTNDETLAAQCGKLRVHGVSDDPYRYEAIGHASRLDEIQAAVLRVKFGKLGQWNDARRANAAVYDRLLGGTDIRTPPVLSETTCHNYHQYTVRHPGRDALRDYLKEHDVGSGVYYPVPLHLQPAYRFFGHREGDFPESERACREVLSLPVQPHLTGEQVEYAADVARHFACVKAGV
ncbi:MAG: DegT/DnrJ/EryC1/StrS family aminotransferase [Armatimonadetes bacterium]|nr:DegT/DnrJ/EryC1/StrS family aminotransferase [Armatimonadota bacterium]